MVQDFKQFLLRGNVVDLAVGIVIGAAFSAVVNAFVKDLLTPLIAAIFGKPTFGSLYFTVNGSQFLYGDFFNTLLSLLIIAAAIFFFVVKPINYLVQRSRQEDSPDPTTMKCPECLSEIPAGAHRCAFCTAELAPAA